MNPPKKCCMTCEYACAPNTAGCICSYGGSGIFHAGIEPCKHYRLADFLKKVVA